MSTETLEAPAASQAAVAQRTHALSRERHGFGLDGYVIPTCSCGWRGRREDESNDWMSTNLREQEQHHVRGAA